MNSAAATASQLPIPRLYSTKTTRSPQLPAARNGPSPFGIYLFKTSYQVLEITLLSLARVSSFTISSILPRPSGLPTECRYFDRIFSNDSGRSKMAIQ